ncbi:hypothetical protein H072_7329 [Dactylellina haptotyla CBS 200.50]|uniref:RING-type domain-containing protein n=1 Tax=Dactylellina haptotyla (strain CBS 200.50) TaxID=1284197 RepID=S8BUC7_DACHA|nr:hypothetical protein H072_7329 [Dactylellina haptotyla CBS 200.50]
MADPLSVSASIAGLVALVAGVAKLAASLRNDQRESCPTQLMLISQEIEVFHALLSRVKVWVEHGRATRGNDQDLTIFIVGCTNVVAKIGLQLQQLEKFSKRHVVRRYLSLSLPNKLKELSSSRDDLERSKTTLIIALSSDNPKILESLGVIEVGIQDLRSAIDTDGSGSQGGLESGIGRIAPPVLWHSFDNWLASFSNDPSASNQAKKDEELANYRLRRQIAGAQPKEVRTALIPQSGVVNGNIGANQLQANVSPSYSQNFKVARILQPKDSNQGLQYNIKVIGLTQDGSSEQFTETLTSDPDTPACELVCKLKDMGYNNVCGFQDLKSKFKFGPTAALDGPLEVAITDGPSCYNLSTGLHINKNTRLIDFFNEFLSQTNTWQSDDDQIVAEINENGNINVRRHPEELESRGVNIKFLRTLRLPEDGKIYTEPPEFGAIPLLSVSEYFDGLPDMIQRKGGYFIPMFQREALALRFEIDEIEKYSDFPREKFALRIYAGSINALTGRPASKKAADGQQDFFVVPKQRRLDGFHFTETHVSQFIAMPLGWDYTVEKQINNSEYIGGVQIEIARRLSTQVAFSRNFNGEIPTISDNTELDIFLTPAELGLTSRPSIIMSCDLESDGFIWERKFNQKKLDQFDKDESVHGYPVRWANSSTWRRIYMHEVVARCGVKNRFLQGLPNPVIIKPVEPFTLDITLERCGQRNFPGQSATLKGYKVSPFLTFYELEDILYKEAKKQETVALDYKLGSVSVIKDKRNLDIMTRDHGPYVPISKFVTNGCTLIYKYRRGPPTSRVGCTSDPPQSYSNRYTKVAKAAADGWSMGVGSGAKINQWIEGTKDTRVWDWQKSRLINIQIINSVAFERFTSIKPFSQISFRQYLHSGFSLPPIIKTYSASAIAPKGNFNAIRTIRDIDSGRPIEIGIYLPPDGQLTCCAYCEVNLCDTVLSPCNHIFCNDCISLNMKSGPDIVCDICETVVSECRRFAGTMEATNTEGSTTPPKDPGASSIVNGSQTTSLASLQLETTIEAITKSLNISRKVTAKDSPTFSHHLHYISHLEKDDQTLVRMAVLRLSKLSLSDRASVLESLLDIIRGKGQVAKEAGIEIFLTLVPNFDHFIGYEDESSYKMSLIKDVFDLKSSKWPGIRERAAKAERPLIKWIDGSRKSLGILDMPLEKLLFILDTPESLDILFKYIRSLGVRPDEHGIHVFSCKRNPDLLRRLIEIGCDPGWKNQYGNTYLHCLRGPELEEIMVHGGAKLDWLNAKGQTCLHCAVETLDWDRIKVLLKRPTAVTMDLVNMKDPSGYTALHRAMSVDYRSSINTKLSPLLAALIDGGADRTIEMPKEDSRSSVIIKYHDKDINLLSMIFDDSMLEDLRKYKAALVDLKPYLASQILSKRNTTETN